MSKPNRTIFMFMQVVMALLDMADRAYDNAMLKPMSSENLRRLGDRIYDEARAFMASGRPDLRECITAHHLRLNYKGAAPDISIHLEAGLFNMTVELGVDGNNRARFPVYLSRLENLLQTREVLSAVILEDLKRLGWEKASSVWNKIAAAEPTPHA